MNRRAPPGSTKHTASMMPMILRWMFQKARDFHLLSHRSWDKGLGAWVITHNRIRRGKEVKVAELRVYPQRRPPRGSGAILRKRKK